VHSVLPRPVDVQDHAIKTAVVPAVHPKPVAVQDHTAVNTAVVQDVRAKPLVVDNHLVKPAVVKEDHAKPVAVAKDSPPVTKLAPQEVDLLSNTQVVEKLSGLSEKGSVTELHDLLSALDTKEGRSVLMYMNVEPAKLQDDIKKLKGSQSDVAAARAAIKSYLHILKPTGPQEKDGLYARKAFRAYVCYSNDQTVKKMIQRSSLKALTIGLRALATAELKEAFKDISFTNQLLTLSTKQAAGQAEVVEEILRWISVTDCNSLTKMGVAYSKALSSSTATTVSAPK